MQLGIKRGKYKLVYKKEYSIKKELTTPLTLEKVLDLHSGDMVNISGIIYAARDAAHKRMIEMLSRFEGLPFCIEDQIIYYVGPCPARGDQIIGAAGPTTSGRMDAYTPRLIELGLKGMIGKGERNEEVISFIKLHKAVYFAAVGGAAALISKSITSQEVIAFEDLGTEAIRKLTVKNFPAIVVIDSFGNNLYTKHL